MFVHVLVNLKSVSENSRLRFLLKFLLKGKYRKKVGMEVVEFYSLPIGDSLLRVKSQSARNKRRRETHLPCSILAGDQSAL